MKGALLLVLVFFVVAAQSIADRNPNDVSYIREENPEELQRSLEMASEEGPIVDGHPKSSWPELVGKTADEAREVLQREAPQHRIQVLQSGMMATMDYRTDRIRVWLNEAGTVARAPMIG